jgi:uncharacterized membrane protein YfcA
MNEWWNATSGTYFGAIAGSGLGIIGGVLGPMIGVFAPKGTHKVLVMSSIWLTLLTSAAILVSGTFAVIQGQPRHVWYPLLLIGGIGSIVVGPLCFMVSKAYRQAEQRKLDAESLRRS